MAGHVKRERVRLTLMGEDQDTCAKVIMEMQQDPRLAGLNLTVHDVARQALTLGLTMLTKQWKVKI